LGKWKTYEGINVCDDIADACIYFLNKKTNHTLINIGTGVEKNINDYAKYIMKHLGVKLKIKYDKENLMDGT
jgi:GDP-L-fucose synthase